MGKRMLCPDTGKRVFFSLIEVKHEVRFQRKNRSKRWYYVCDHCKLFHITSKPPKALRDANREKKNGTERAS